MNREQIVKQAEDIADSVVIVKKLAQGASEYADTVLVEQITELLEQFDLKMDELDARKAYNNLLLTHLKVMINLADDHGDVDNARSIREATRIAFGSYYASS